MSAIFNTHQFYLTLEKGPFTKEQAETLTKAWEASLSDMVKDDLATKKDIQDLRVATQKDIQDLKHEINLIKWMLGFIFAGILSLIAKAFFS